MFDAAGNFGSVVANNLPIFPSLPAASTLVCSNNTAGSGTYSMAFNVTSKTATFSSSSSLGSPQSFTVTYFGAGVVDPNEYEIRAEATAPSTGANIALAGGSAPLNTWITLGASPSFNFSCSGRRSGNVSVTITIRHKVQTTYSSTRSYLLQQASDAVAPLFGGGFGNSISLSVFAGESFTMGFYIDNASTANEWMLRSYRNGSYIQGLTGSVSFGGISESEYQVSVFSATNTGPMPFNSGVGGGVISSLRSNGASATSGNYYSGSGSTGPGSATLVIRFRHTTDENVFSDLTLTLNKTS